MHLISLDALRSYPALPKEWAVPLPRFWLRPELASLFLVATKPTATELRLRSARNRANALASPLILEIARPCKCWWPLRRLESENPTFWFVMSLGKLPSDCSKKWKRLSLTRQ